MGGWCEGGAWRSFGASRATASGRCAAYHHLLRSAALDRFDWQERDLNLREAVCVFRYAPTRLDASLRTGYSLPKAACPL